MPADIKLIRYIKIKGKQHYGVVVHLTLGIQHFI